MKDKHKVEYLRDLSNRLLDDLSVRVSTETDSPCLFAIVEADSLSVKAEPTPEQIALNQTPPDIDGYGFLLEFLEPNKLPVVLYRRAYSKKKGLTTAQLIAFEEFIRTAVNLYSGFSLQTMMNKTEQKTITSGLLQEEEEEKESPEAQLANKTYSALLTEQGNASNEERS